MTETSSFMSLLRAKLVATNHFCFPIWTVNLAHRIDDQMADQSLQSIIMNINHFGVIFH